MKKNIDELKSKLVGAVQTIFVPFDNKLKIDYKSLRKHITYLCSLDFVRCLYLMPYNGRYSQLSENEILNLNRFCIKEVKKRNKIIIVSDPIHTSTEIKFKFCLDAKKYGADIFSSICREKYYSDKQIYLHYKKLSSAKIPLLVHLMPFLSGYDGANMQWKDSTLKKISQISNIIAIKEDTKNKEYGKKILKLYRNRFSIIFASRKNLLLDLRSYGLNSYLNGSSVVDAYIDKIFLELFRNDIVAAKKFIIEIDDPFWDKTVKKYGWHRVNKACLEINGVMKRFERLPMIALNDQEFVELKRNINVIKKRLRFMKKFYLNIDYTTNEK